MSIWIYLLHHGKIPTTYVPPPPPARRWVSFSDLGVVASVQALSTIWNRSAFFSAPGSAYYKVYCVHVCCARACFVAVETTFLATAQIIHNAYIPVHQKHVYYNMINDIISALYAYCRYR